MCGVGVFALPSAFQQAGLWMGVALTFGLGLANAHCMIKLVRCSQYLSELKSSYTKNDISPDRYRTSSTRAGTRGKEQLSRLDISDNNPESEAFHSDSGKEHSINRISLDYGSMAEEAFARRGVAIGKFKLVARILVNLCIIGLQTGICSVFYIFVIDHIKEMSDYLFSTNLNRNNLFFIMVPFFIVLTTVRSLNLMSWISCAGNVLVMGAIGVILVQLVFMPHISLRDLSGITTIEGTAISAGSIVYAFAAQAVVLPIENKMRSPQHMVGFFGVISTAVIFVGIVYVIIGSLGYITYGERVLGSITLNLTNSPLDLSVKVMLTLMTYCGYLIQHYPIVEMLWISIERHLHGRNQCVKSALNYAIRYTVVILSFALAYSIPNIKQMIPFVGVTTGMMLALVFPALLEFIVFYDDWRKESTLKFLYNIIVNVVYMVLGLLFVVLAITSIPHGVQSYAQFGAAPFSSEQIQNFPVPSRPVYYKAIPYTAEKLKTLLQPYSVKLPPITQATLKCKECNCCLLSRSGPFGPIIQKGKDECCQCGSCDDRVANNYSSENRSIYPSITPTILPSVSPISPLLPPITKPPISPPEYPAPIPYRPYNPIYPFQPEGSYPKPSLYNVAPSPAPYYPVAPSPFYTNSYPYKDEYAINNKIETYLTPPPHKPIGSLPYATSSQYVSANQQVNDCDDGKWSECCPITPSFRQKLVTCAFSSLRKGCVQQYQVKAEGSLVSE
ncbi:hypothetical protein KIN20_000539 [Parelaphostrongylus tenuis]|uniref:Amino acid transporter transmembrane domain-containing protein n=1 Tax=Parelaphostrongylus tenuis TaxID=148309 RepID=A0AAD5LUW0_PARTN|nr:hypothetical protein KIN20_000539 [Parelaphostrongylus tenuis]